MASEQQGNFRLFVVDAHLVDLDLHGVDLRLDVPSILVAGAGDIGMLGGVLCD